MATRNWVLTTLAAGAIAVVSSTTAEAAILNCVTSCNTTFAGAFFTTTDNQSTGSGVIQSFVRISTNNTSESGYNTSARPLEFDENNSGTFTHDLTLAAVPIVNIGGTNYREFLLDINQNNSQGCTTSGNPVVATGDACLSLDQLQIFQSTTGGNTGYPNIGTKIYDLDAGGNNWILLNYGLNSGSGSGDLFVYIPNSLFDTTKGFVYLFSQFGTENANNDGYEEWAVRTPTTVTGQGGGVPEPATLALLGVGLMAGGLRMRKRR